MIATQHYRELPERMFELSNPSPSPAPKMVQLNRSLLTELGADSDWFQSDAGLATLSGNQLIDGVPAVALAYGGHQFGQWVPLLGDGRAHMLGQIVSGDTTVDVQLKGSGRTRFSRQGDGRATLGSVLREYIVSEAMAALGIPTTRSLAIIATGEPVMRERAYPGAILVRTAASHIRVGSFEYASSQGVDDIRALADFVIDKHYPASLQHENPYLALINAVIERQATLIARWMLVGFIHGVMNTDNTSVTGETIDYGPCAFMDEFHPRKVFSSIDRFGRYAWDQQPSIAHWNLSRLAQTLVPLLHDSPQIAAELANDALDGFEARFHGAFNSGVCNKLGLVANAEANTDFIQETFRVLTESAIDFTVFFDHLTQVAAGARDDLVADLFEQVDVGTGWLDRWRTHRTIGSVDWTTMRHANPAVIARNHRIEQVIEAAQTRQDYAPFRRLCTALQTPYELASGDRDLQTPPEPQERVTQTFCGT